MLLLLGGNHILPTKNEKNVPMELFLLMPFIGSIFIKPTVILATVSQMQNDRIAKIEELQANSVSHHRLAISATFV